MAHYAYLDSGNVVTMVIVGKDENTSGVDWESYYGAKRTSYNTRGGVHLMGGTPFRKNFASVGFVYNDSLDAFIPPQPFPSWTLNTQSCLWEPPVPRPDGYCVWDEETTSWKEIINDPL